MNSEPIKRKKRKFEHWQKIMFCLFLYDAVAVVVAYVGALALRFDFRLSQVPYYYIKALYWFLPFYVVFCLAVFYFLKLYRSIWRFASYTELKRVIIATFITALVHTIGISFIERMPISYYVLGAAFQGAFVLGIRFLYRFVLLLRASRDEKHSEGPRIMLVGAGEAGRILLRDIHLAKETEGHVLCIIDDNQNKWGRDIDGIPIVGGRYQISEKVQEYKIDRIYVAIPSASEEDRRAILNICKETNCELKNLPGMYQMVNGEINIRSLRDVAIEDLLGRSQVSLDMDDVKTYLDGKTVLVTGGGGSIGSELCRQIAELHPKQLIIFDVYENNAYEIEQELKRHHPELNLLTLIGSVRDSHRLETVFSTYRPEVVYHAAAHKHVPLMEASPCEAVKNNAVGTYKTAYAAMHHGCERFVLISTDKAVNPTNIMGASKRVCEMVIQMFDAMVKAGRALEIPELHAHIRDEEFYRTVLVPADQEARSAAASTDIHTEFVAVRFGNVLGSNGSVIPQFRKQIDEGGPVLVTDPNIIRYFMTIKEAVSLVLQAGVLGEGSEIFVLDMGEPIKIDDLARTMIRLSGLKPDVDIMVKYTGLRPGEKLYEERLMAEEGLRMTSNHKIFIGQPIPFDYETFPAQLRELLQVSYDDDEEQLKKLMQEVVVTYHPAENGASA